MTNIDPLKIDPIKVTVRELVTDYADNDEGGVTGYAGMLNIRPAYQREFVYNPKQAADVIRTVKRGFPLNVMYWAAGDDDHYEIIDGQQRTISLCQYVQGRWSVDDKSFGSLQTDQQEKILDYELTVYLCDGGPSEKLAWFEIVNTAGEKLNPQELRNATYHGPWLTAAKQFFSRTGKGAAAYGLASHYLTGTPKRQDYLETAIEWMGDGEPKDRVTRYMDTHRHDVNANEIVLHFKRVIDWVETTFPMTGKHMQGLPWGDLYREHGARAQDTVALTARVAELMVDEDVTNKKGIYSYVLDPRPATEHHLNIRAFSAAQKTEAYQRQDGICPRCNERHEEKDMQGDHIIPWVDGGRTVPGNCQMLCRHHNGSKGAR